MKYLMGILLMCSGAFAWSESLPDKEVVFNIKDAFIPGGFSQDSDAYVVVIGEYPNSCYSWGGADVRHVGDKVHEVVSKAKVLQGQMCLMFIRPFSNEVRLGQLSRGEHTLRFMNEHGNFFERTLVVE